MSVEMTLFILSIGVTLIGFALCIHLWTHFKGRN